MIEFLIGIGLLIWLWRWLGRSVHQPPQHIVLEIVLRSAPDEPEDETLRSGTEKSHGDNVVPFPRRGK